jgi:anti-sigma factor RsiW
MRGSNKNYEVGSPEAGELWRRIGTKNGSGSGLEAPDPLLIAAYVDGTLDPPARARVEAWMAGSSDALDLVLAARAAHADAPSGAPMAAPAGLLTRAQGLVRPRAAADTGWQRGVADWFAGMAPPGIAPSSIARPGMWAATAAAMVFAAVVSFELGRETTVKLAATRADTLIVAAADDDGLGFDPSSGDLL